MSLYRTLAFVSLGCAGIMAAIPDTAYRTKIEQWRQQRESGLKADGGWLTVTGLFWLREGPNSLGSGPQNDVVLPETAPESLGIVKVDRGMAVFTASAPVVTLNGKPVNQAAALHYAGPVDVLSAGPLDLLLLKRGDRLAVRLKDRNSELRKNFTHLNWYPVSEDWKITGKFVALPAPEKLVLDSIIGEPEVMQT